MLGTAAVLVSIACVRGTFPLASAHYWLSGAACQWALFGQRESQPAPTTGCHIAISAASAAHIAASWECLFAYDTLLVILTLSRGRAFFGQGPARRRGAAAGAWTVRNLGAVVTRDGLLYYAAAALVNGANVVTFYAAPPLLRGVLSNPASVLSTVLCSRLVLNMHASADEASPLDPFTSTTSTAVLDTRVALTNPSALDICNTGPDKYNLRRGYDLAGTDEYELQHLECTRVPHVNQSV
jgi:hypothetical protein